MMAEQEKDSRMKIAKWLKKSFPPIHLVAILPFLLGTFLAWRLHHTFTLSVFALGSLGAVLVIVSTCHTGEYFNYVKGEKAGRRFVNRFIRGASLIRAESLSQTVVLRTSVITIMLAGIIGLILQFGLETGPLTLILGGLGALSGFLYSTSPIRPIETSLGELIISACYGWLPAASAFYIQRGYIAPCIHWMALPIGLSIFNVILLNEFSDFYADVAVGKQTLLVRLGKDKGMVIYVLVSIFSWFCMVFPLHTGIPKKALYFHLPVIALSTFICFMMARRKYENPFVRELLCGLNIAVYLGTTAAYMLAFL
ncbi:MAG: prenyltransferase [Deltaproteobacteria bacterium]|nr:prenyltransferase [Deltaproteobacteria bacterium]